MVHPGTRYSYSQVSDPNVELLPLGLQPYYLPQDVCFGHVLSVLKNYSGGFVDCKIRETRTLDLIFANINIILSLEVYRA